MFDWMDWSKSDDPNPEDLIFYRADWSLFFWSETHEGKGAIYERADEDVSAAIDHFGWREKKNVHPYGFPPEMVSIDDMFIKKRFKTLTQGTQGDGSSVCPK